MVLPVCLAWLLLCCNLDIAPDETVVIFYLFYAVLLVEVEPNAIMNDVVTHDYLEPVLSCVL